MTQITEGTVEPNRRLWHILMVLQVAAFALLGCYCAASQRYLFADGSGFFLGILNQRSVCDFFPARYFAHVLTQVPAVFLARNLECSDIGLIGFTYGATLFLTPLFGLIITYWAARNAPGYYLAFPMLSQSILYLTTSFIMFCEIHPAVWLFWCILYLLAFSERLEFLESALLIVLGVLATRTYESYLFLAWPLVLVAWRRGQLAWVSKRHGEFLACIASALLSVAAAAVALYSTIFPFDAENRSNFARSLFEHLACLPVQFSLLVLIGGLYCSLMSRRALGMVFWLSVTCYGLVVVAPLTWFNQDWPYQYYARVQALYVPLLLGGLVAVNPQVLRNLSDFPYRQFDLWRLTAWTCAVSVAFQWTATVRWNEYRSALLHELSEHRGVIEYDQSGHRSSEFDWDMPPLCVAVSALNLGSVSTIIGNPGNSESDTFDPWDPDSLPDLRKYGIFTDLGKNKVLKHGIDDTEGHFNDLTTSSTTTPVGLVEY